MARDISIEDFHAPTNLNSKQLIAYSTILYGINVDARGFFFVDGLGGTGKTYFYLALLETTRLRGMIVIAMTKLDVAFSIIPSGRKSHLRFKIPINNDESNMCNLSNQSGTT